MEKKSDPLKLETFGESTERLVNRIKKLFDNPKPKLTPKQLRAREKEKRAKKARKITRKNRK